MDTASSSHVIYWDSLHTRLNSHHSACPKKKKQARKWYRKADWKKLEDERYILVANSWLFKKSFNSSMLPRQYFTIHRPITVSHRHLPFRNQIFYTVRELFEWSNEASCIFLALKSAGHLTSNVSKVKFKFRSQLKLLPQISQTTTFIAEGSIISIYNNIID